ncbi:hypothetical protein [Maribacter halichondriae]|uniref:hypothetical protein n=1 Tax=Maribacter halichondriae TaxID=2980554 RepID=UPI002358E366|nr:hypothetical protein [Maribacter sp. Hal144]
MKQQRDYYTTDQQQQDVFNANLTVEKSPLAFEYIGTSSLSVKGSITNKSYTFRFKGDILAIDIRDVPSMLAEPYLQRVSS